MRFNSEWLGRARLARAFIRLAANYNVARMLERRDFRQRFDAGQPISRPRVPLPARPGLRLGRAQGRRRARRHRPALQPQRRPRHHAGLRPRAAGRAHDAAPRGHGRRREDVEEPRQLHRRHRAARRDVRQAHEHLGRAHVALLRPAHRPLAGRDRRGEGGAAGRWPRRWRSAAASWPTSTAPPAAEAAEAEWRRVHQERQAPSELRWSRVAAGRTSRTRLVVAAGLAKSNGEAVRLLRQRAVRRDGNPVEAGTESSSPRGRASSSRSGRRATSASGVQPARGRNGGAPGGRPGALGRGSRESYSTLAPDSRNHTKTWFGLDTGGRVS